MSFSSSLYFTSQVLDGTWQFGYTSKFEVDVTSTTINTNSIATPNTYVDPPLPTSISSLSSSPPPSTPSLSLYAYLCSNLHLKSEGHVISPPINTHHHRSLSPAQEKFSDFPLLSLYLPLSSPFSLHEFSLSQFDHLLLPISE